MQEGRLGSASSPGCPLLEGLGPLGVCSPVGALRVVREYVRTSSEHNHPARRG